MAVGSVTVDVSGLLRRGGMVDQYVERRAMRVESRAKVLCPVDSGELRRSIKREAGPQGSWWVSADKPYASWIHEGQRFDPRAGDVVLVKVGPRPFLVDALQAAL